MSDKIRKRGWSIASTEDGSSAPTAPNNRNNPKNSVFPPRSARPRANTDYSEDTLTPSQKEELLKFPDMDELEALDSRVKAIDKSGGRGNNNRVVVNKDNSAATNGGEVVVIGSDDSDSDEDEMFGGEDKGCEKPEEDDVIDMFGDDDDEHGNERPPKKKKKLNDNDVNDEDVDETETETETSNRLRANEAEAKSLQQLENRKKKLSKWASRLFDPDRPRGLVETPKVIPLSDEFLIQFGQRERDYFKDTGKPIEIDHGNIDDHDDHQDSKKEDKNLLKPKKEGVKVKLLNLSYKTSTETLTLACEKHGPLIEVKLVMDPKSPKQSLGRAFVLFETLEGAESCIAKMNEKILDGRQLRVTKADGKRKAKGGIPGGGVGGKGGLARYWEKDITTKCFRCGQVGHMSDRCTNEELPRPCIYCAKIGHDTWSCPLSKICFKCGVPGHINRDCPERRHIPRRLVCGICFMSGHDRWQCRERIQNIPSYNAQCFVCGRTGHFMCKAMQWFFGLTGISCFNCGQAGHHGNDCKRPKLTDLSRNPELALSEIDRAQSLSLLEVEEEVSGQRRNGNGDRDDMRHRDASNQRGRERSYDNRIPERNSNHHYQYEQLPRASSQPPEGFYSSQNQSSSYGRIGQHSTEESYSSLSSRRRDRDYRDETLERSRVRRSEMRSDSRGYGSNERTSSTGSRHHRNDPRARHDDSRSDRRGYR